MILWAIVIFKRPLIKIYEALSKTWYFKPFLQLLFICSFIFFQCPKFNIALNLIIIQSKSFLFFFQTLLMITVNAENKWLSTWILLPFFVFYVNKTFCKSTKLLSLWILNNEQKIWFFITCLNKSFKIKYFLFLLKL